MIPPPQATSYCAATVKANLINTIGIKKIHAVEKKYLMEKVSEEAYKEVINNLRGQTARLQKDLVNLHTNEEAYFKSWKALFQAFRSPGSSQKASVH